MTRTYRLLCLRGTSARCVTVLVTKEKAVISKNELVLAIAGGIFVIEALSVMIQIGSIKLRGKKVFRMAPIHHHFELKGWPEPLIIVRFWIVSVICALVTLGTLKLRCLQTLTIFSRVQPDTYSMAR